MGGQGIDSLITSPDERQRCMHRWTFLTQLCLIEPTPELRQSGKRRRWCCATVSVSATLCVTLCHQQYTVGLHKKIILTAAEGISIKGRIYGDMEAFDCGPLQAEAAHKKEKEVIGLK